MKILLVDDHAATRKEMAALINAEKDMSVVAEAASGREGVAKARELKPDLVIMDILMPDINGVEASRAIMANDPKARILVLSNHFGGILVQALLSADVKGYIRKDHAFEELAPAICAIAGGGTYFGREIDD